MATIQEILDHVGDDRDRARRELEHEHASDSPRSTLIAQLQTIAAKEQPVTDQTTTTDPEVDEDTGLAPGPEQPRDVSLFAGDKGTTILPVSVRDEDVDPDSVDNVRLVPDPDADVEDTLIEGAQAEFITAAANGNGLALSINGDVFLLNAQMVAALKQVVDKAVVGLSL